MRYQKGFIAVFREDYNDHFEGGADLFGLFIYLAMNAHRHKEPTTYTKGRQVYSVGFGEFYTTYNYLGRWTGTSYRTLKVRLDLLEHRKYITRKQFDNCMCVAIHVDIMQRMVNTDGNAISPRMSTLMDKETRGQSDKETRENNISRPSSGDAADDLPKVSSEKALKEIKRAKKPEKVSIPPKKLFDLWNELSGPLKGNQVYTPTRAKACKARLTEKPDLEYWRAVIVRIRNTPFCLGHNNRNWRADIDFLLRVNTHIKVMEGKYEKKAPIGHSGAVKLAQNNRTQIPANAELDWGDGVEEFFK